MTTWINKLKQILLGFLSTHDNKYIITDTGLKLVAFDYTFQNAVKSSTTFTNKSKTSSVWANKTKS
jgi:hypothetical protein